MSKYLSNSDCLVVLPAIGQRTCPSTSPSVCLSIYLSQPYFLLHLNFAVYEHIYSVQHCKWHTVCTRPPLSVQGKHTAQVVAGHTCARTKFPPSDSPRWASCSQLRNRTIITPYARLLSICLCRNTDSHYLCHLKTNLCFLCIFPCWIQVC